ncbi:hypothetical protein FAI40_06925 [Acetobacteraceae bacterium]|nr:hypothetical protein FAI40_06925 [Acetobacteraceae bacterium]
MSKISLYFLHGWGFSADFWNETIQYLPSEKYQIILGEAGYFGQRKIHLPPKKFIGIGHSLGFMQLLEKTSNHPNCIGLLGINSFPCFAQQRDFPDGVPSRLLERMQRNLAKNPSHVLNQFYQNCGNEKQISPDNPLNLDHLKKALNILVLKDMRPLFNAFRVEGKILGMLSGKTDPLSPAKHLWTDTQTQIDSGHLAPLTHPTFCATWIKKSLKS